MSYKFFRASQHTQPLAAMRMQNRTGMATAGAMHSTAGSYFAPNPAAATLAIQGQRSTAISFFHTVKNRVYITLIHKHAVP